MVCWFGSLPLAYQHHAIRLLSFWWFPFYLSSWVLSLGSLTAGPQSPKGIASRELPSVSPRDAQKDPHTSTEKGPSK